MILSICFLILRIEAHTSANALARSGALPSHELATYPAIQRAAWQRAWAGSGLLFWQYCVCSATLTAFQEIMLRHSRLKVLAVLLRED